MAFVRVLYSGIWPRHRVSNQNNGISMTSLKIIVPYEHVTTYQIESNQIEKIYQLIESIKFHINDITSVNNRSPIEAYKIQSVTK